MNLKIIRRIIVVSFVIITFSSFSVFDNAKKNKVVLELISKSIMQWHYQPIKIDDDFSEKAYKLYIKRLDFGKRFFIAEDIAKLDAYKLKIDDEINNETFGLLETANSLLSVRIKEVESFYKDILTKPFDFTVNESAEFDEDKTQFATNSDALRENWRKYLKYQVLTRLSDALDIQETAIEKKDTLVKVKPFDSLEYDSRMKVKKQMEDWFHRLGKQTDSERFSDYMNAITGIFDPHTEFFPPKEKNNFDIAMSGKFEGIGATLTQKDAYIKVDKIIPGSASWRQGQLKEGDVILRVGQGNEESVDVVDMRLDEAVQLIRGKKGTVVMLTVKKVDGSIQVIPIVRDIVVLEETFAKSAIIKNPDNQERIGYIYLPSFYADFNDATGRYCFADVAKEVEKLKSEKVDGIILDLRNNGGGSLSDVVKMAGLFIKNGPIVQDKTRFGLPNILQDNDTTQQYTGPLAIMVNYFSASASEIMAAAMQDYKRAIIVGSTSTFGKGSVQRVLDFDDMVGEMKDVKPLGAIKMTIQKFYRINGGTTQLKGVVPDIILPDAYQFVDVGERELDFPMKWDEIKSLKYSVCNSYSEVEKLQKKSKQRIGKNKRWDLVEKQAQFFKDRKNNTLISLNLEQYRSEQKKWKKDSKQFEENAKQTTGIEVFGLKSDLSEIANDTIKTTRMNNWHKDLKNDLYLFETMSVIKDMKK